MGVKRVINTDFWKDDVVAEEYSAEDRYFMLYLLSNPNTKQCGIYHLPVRTIAFEMGYKESAAQAILDRFETSFKNIKYNKETKEVAILNFLKHSIVKGGKPVEDCVRKELSQVKDTNLIVAIFNHMLPHMNKQISLNENSMYIGLKNVFLEFINDIDIDNDNDNENERIVVRIVKEPIKAKESSRFTPPTAEEVKEYCLERTNNIDSEHFIDFYSSKGWMIGKNKMKDWKAAVRNWEKREKETVKVDKPKNNNKFNNFKQREYDYDELEKKLQTKQSGGN